MSNQIQNNPALHQKLLSFSHRRLTRGEMLLFARALSNIIPLPSEGDVNIRIHNLNHRSTTEPIIGRLGDYAYVPKEDSDTVYHLLDQFMDWRNRIAKGNLNFVLTGNFNTFVQDLSGLPMIVDNTYLSDGASMDVDGYVKYEMFVTFIAAVR